MLQILNFKNHHDDLAGAGRAAVGLVTPSSNESGRNTCGALRSTSLSTYLQSLIDHGDATTERVDLRP